MIQIIMCLIGYLSVPEQYCKMISKLTEIFFGQFYLSLFPHNPRGCSIVQLCSKYLWQCLLLVKLQPGYEQKMGLRYMYFPGHLAEFQSTPWWLILTKFNGQKICSILFSILRKMELWYRSFPENIFKFFWTAILQSCSKHDAKIYRQKKNNITAFFSIVFPPSLHKHKIFHFQNNNLQC